MQDLSEQVMCDAITSWRRYAAALLDAERVKRGLTQAELAALLECSQASISGVFKGSASAELILRCGVVLGWYPPTLMHAAYNAAEFDAAEGVSE